MTRKIGRMGLAGGALALGLVLSSAAGAAAPRACADTDVSPTAIACQGWFTGNLLGNSAADTAAEAAALDALPGVSGFTASNVGGIDTVENLNGATTISFHGKTLTGDVIVGFHNGAAKGEMNNIGAEGTAFFLIDFLTPVTSFTLNVPGSSGARLYEDNGGTTRGGGVPESASWALLVLGMGVLGAGLRMRRSGAVAATA